MSDGRKRFQVSMDEALYRRWKRLVPSPMQSLVAEGLLATFVTYLEKNESMVDAFMGAALDDRILIEFGKIIPRKDL